MNVPAILDTSVFVAHESGRPLATSELPDDVAVSVVTIAELHVGVLATEDSAVRSQRLATLIDASSLEAFGITSDVARRWAELRVRMGISGRNVKVNDLWIAATAMANGMDVVTQDNDFDVIEAAGGPRVIKV